jgi:K+ potassium transporter
LLSVLLYDINYSFSTKNFSFLAYPNLFGIKGFVVVVYQLLIKSAVATAKLVGPSYIEYISLRILKTLRFYSKQSLTHEIFYSCFLLDLLHDYLLPELQEFDMGRMAFLTLQTFAVVFGDIGLGPLYTFDVMFTKSPIRGEEDVIGALSLVLYTLLLIPLVKYVSIVLWANDDSEGTLASMIVFVTFRITFKFYVPPSYKHVCHDE